MVPADRRNNSSKALLESMAAARQGATASSSPPRRPVVGASPIFSSSPPVGLLNLTRSASSLPNKTSAPHKTSAQSAPAVGVHASAPAPATLRLLLVRHREKIVLGTWALMGVWQGAKDTPQINASFWLGWSCVLVFLLWIVEMVKLMKQLFACRSLTGLAVISLQHLPVVKAQFLVLSGGFAIFVVLLFGVSKIHQALLA